MLKIRQAIIPDDIKELMSVEQTCFSNGFSGSVFFYLEKCNGSSFYIAEDCNRNILEYCLGLLSTQNTGWIVSIAVFPQFQRQGLGTNLLNKVEKALANHTNEILLTVKTSNSSAIDFYKSNLYNIAPGDLNIYGDNCLRYTMRKSVL